VNAIPELYGLRDTLACSRLPGIDRREPSLFKVLQAAAANAASKGGRREPPQAAVEGSPASTAAHAAESTSMGWELLPGCHDHVD